MTYAFIKGLTDNFNECPYAKNSLRSDVRNMINGITKKYPSTKYSIVNSFLEILPSLKEKYSGSAIETCEECGEPSSNSFCRACIYVKELKNG
jgi:uncharacterized protein (TIGR00269 family)